MTDLQLVSLMAGGLAIAGMWICLLLGALDKRVRTIEMNEGLSSIRRVQWRSTKKRKPWWRRWLEKVSKL